MQTQAKVVIIGGGMMGVGLAYHLAEAGWTSVIFWLKVQTKILFGAHVGNESFADLG